MTRKLVHKFNACWNFFDHLYHFNLFPVYYSTYRCTHINRGCDTVSAFSQKGTKKADRPLFKNESYVKAIMKAGQVWTLSGLTFIATEALVFHLYGRKYQRDLLRI